MNFILMKKIVGIRRGLVYLVVLLFDFQYNFRFASCIKHENQQAISCHIMVLNSKIIAQSLKSQI